MTLGACAARWLAPALVAASASVGETDAEPGSWIWAFAPATGHTSSLGWTGSAGLFVGRRLGEPSEGYASGLGALLQVEGSSRGRRYAVGAHVVVRPDGIPVVGTLGAGANFAVVELREGSERVTLIGPEIQLAFVLRFRVGYLFQAARDGPADRGGLTWSVGVGF